LQPGRALELAGPLPHAPLPAGSLRLADLGDYSLAALQEYGRQGVCVLSRLPARTALFAAQGWRWKLHEFLAAQPDGRVDRLAPRFKAELMRRTLCRLGLPQRTAQRVELLGEGLSLRCVCQRSCRLLALVQHRYQ
jgi:hypothetical protein